MNREQAEAAIAAMNAAFANATPEEGLKSAEKILREMLIPEKFIAQVSEGALQYLGEIDKFEAIQIGRIQIYGGADVVSHSRSALPGCVVSRLGFVPIAAEQDGSEYCLDIVSDRVYLLPFEWFDDGDPEYLQEAYSSEKGVVLVRKYLTVSNLMERDPIVIDSLQMFFDSVVSVTCDD